MLNFQNLPKRQFTCPHCMRAFKASVVQPLKASLEVLPCNACGDPAVIQIYDEVYTWFLKRDAAKSGFSGAGTVALEEVLVPCHCGGRYRREAPARCPDCKKSLELAAGAKGRAEQLPILGEPRLAPGIWDRGSERLREELAQSALYCLDPSGSRFSQGCLALPALALLDPDRAFTLFRQVLEANPEQLDEDLWYSDEQDYTLFTLAVGLLTAAINGGGDKVLPYVASRLSSRNAGWVSFMLEAMKESDQLNRQGGATWMRAPGARSNLERLLRGA